MIIKILALKALGISLFHIPSLKGQTLSSLCCLMYLGLHMYCWPLVISSDLVSSAEPNCHHQCSMCSLLCSQEIVQQLALDLPDCIYLFSAPPLDYELPKGLDLPFFILNCSVQPSAWHKKIHHSECLPGE